MKKSIQKIFNASAPEIQQLIRDRNWQNLVDRNKIVRILNFVKDEILFGFTPRPLLPASQVLAAGCGQAISKSILLKTLLDACGILCRYHAFTVKKELYRGLARPLEYHLLPAVLPSSWIEVFFEGQWLIADGVLLDSAYLQGLQPMLTGAQNEYIGRGIALYLPANTPTVWNGKNHTYCQRAAITRDLGIIDDFEWFFQEYRRDIRQLGNIGPKHANRMINALRYPE
ncbi:MAG: transglutaminase domain-containing protein [Candidatus Marinimicrobia bacterium]|nr:transglutaminase domain-containing protein [Candidatus Neomarinimicrobiota bacterium]